MFWILENEEDVMVSKGEAEDDLDDIFEQTFSFEHGDDEPVIQGTEQYPAASSVNNVAAKNSNLVNLKIIFLYALQ